MDRQQVLLLSIALIVGTFFICNFLSAYWKSHENFNPENAQYELSQYFDGGDSTKGIRDYTVDTMVCSKKCCGDQWPTPFDGLSSEEVQQTISTMRNSGPFVRTNYTCANGIDGVGCPCINTKAYEFIVNHGHNAHTINDIEPTFLIRGDVGSRGEVQGVQAGDMLSPYEALQAERSMFVDTPKMNDLQLQRSTNSVDKVMGIADM